MWCVVSVMCGSLDLPTYLRTAPSMPFVTKPWNSPRSRRFPCTTMSLLFIYVFFFLFFFCLYMVCLFCQCCVAELFLGHSLLFVPFPHSPLTISASASPTLSVYSTSIECKESDSVASTGKFSSFACLLCKFPTYPSSCLWILCSFWNSLPSSSFPSNDLENDTESLSQKKMGSPRQESENHKEELFG